MNISALQVSLLRRPEPSGAGQRPVPSGTVRRTASLLLTLALLGLLVHDLFSEHGFLAMRRSQKEAQRLRLEIQKINEENRNLAEQIRALKSDPRTIERIAREEMGLVRPGELIYKLPAKPPEPSKSQAPSR
jgi:cell division protein FtsB